MQNGHEGRRSGWAARPALVAAMLLAVGAVPLRAQTSRPTGAAPDQPPGAVRGVSDLARGNAQLEAETRALEKEIELAGGKQFYLVLDPTVPDLTLMLRGAELRRYRILALAEGEPRVAYVRRGTGAEWQGVVFANGRLDPPRELDRLEITPPPATSQGEEPKVIVPPTPEEAYPVPLRYHIRFDRGPSIEIRPREADPSSRWARLTTWWGARWRDTLAALHPPADELVRLRLVLAPEDANTLYRSLPPDVKLLVQAYASEARAVARPARH